LEMLRQRARDASDATPKVERAMPADRRCDAREVGHEAGGVDPARLEKLPSGPLRQVTRCAS